MTFTAGQPGSLGRKLAQAAFLTLALGLAAPSLARAEAVTAEKVVLLHDLAQIESDTRLALLLSDTQLSPAGMAFASDALVQDWPAVKDHLMAAGIEDFEPILRPLAEAGDPAALREAGRDVMIALTRARSQLTASEADIAASVLELTREAAALISASGPTPVEQYRDAWALLSVARSEADLLLRAKDPVVAKVAPKIILALDDALLFLPDPAASAPAEVDPALLTGAAETVRTLIGSGT